MSKEIPTLADMVYADGLRKRRERLNKIRSAQKFVLDAEMSRYLAHLATDVYKNVLLTPGITQMLDQHRQLAIAPFENVWIEFDNLTRLFELEKMGKLNYIPPEIRRRECSVREGWLVERLDEATFRSTMFSLGGDGKLAMMLYSFAWCTDNRPPSVVPYKVVDPGVPLGTAACNFVTCTRNEDSVVLDMNIDRPQKHKAAIEAVTEFAGEVRSLWAILRTINDLPIVTRYVKPTKGHLLRGQIRPYLAHNVISLRVPMERALRTLHISINRANAHNRRHKVRGHWRDFDVDKACEHDWFIDHRKRLCLLCEAEGTYVKDHERGDASLGYVTHDYHVSKREK